MRPEKVSGDAVTVARRIAASRSTRIGFVPADHLTDVPRAIAEISSALAEVTESGVATVGAPASRSESGDEGSATGIWTFSKRGAVSVFIPREQPEPGQWLAELELFLSDSVAAKEMVLVDFTGLERVGQLAAASALVDASCVVARARKTKERDMEGACAHLRRDRFLGVLLV